MVTASALFQAIEKKAVTELPQKYAEKSGMQS
jgi:hypothetical protein